jgi:hypothetical protein
MIIVVLIFSLLIIFAIYSSSNYIFAQKHESKVNELPTLELIEEEKIRTYEIKENSEISEYNWKTCSEPRLGFSIEYPSHWMNNTEYDEFYAQ